MKKISWSFCLCLLPLLVWGGTGQSGVFSGGFTGDLVFDQEATPQTDTSANTLTINGGLFNGNIIVGQTQSGSALENELRLVGGTIQSPNVVSGISQEQNASNNILRVGNVSLQSNVVAGQGAATAQSNAVILNGSTIEHNALTGNRVIGGETFNGQALYNVVRLDNATQLDTTAAAGYSANAGAVSYNEVIVTGGSVIGNTDGTNAVYGGFSNGGNAQHNQVSLLDTGAVSADIYGGASVLADASYNLVLAEETQVTGNVYGGYGAGAGNTWHNEVRIGSSSDISGNIYGGYNAAGGAVWQNKVSVSAGAMLGDSTSVYGGYATSGAASQNQVSLQSASAGTAAYGGYSVSGAADKNMLSVSGATQGGAVLAGGFGASSATQNSLTIVNSRLSGGTFYGGQSANGSASANKVVIADSELSGNVYGGYSGGGAASGNQVILKDSTINGDVYAGFSENASAETKNNTLVLTGNTTIIGNIYGGNAVNGANRLLLEHYQGEVREVDSFEQVVVKGLDSYVGFRRTTQASFLLDGRPSATQRLVAYSLADGSSLRLLSDTLGVYRYTLTEGHDGTRTYWVAQGAFDKSLAKPYEQAQLAELTLVSMGDDMLTGAFEEALSSGSSKEMFGSVQYADSQYDTGSHFELKSMVAQAGRWFKSQENVFGLFAQYAHGNYTTHPVRASGKIDAFGLGGFWLLPYSSNGYIQTIVRTGYKSDDFDSALLSSSFENNGFYLGASGGIVQRIDWLSLYGKVNWAYLFGDGMHDDLGQRIRFQDSQSVSGQVGLRARLGRETAAFVPYASLSARYELLAKSDVRIDGHRANEADLKGLTAQAEVGVTYQMDENILPLKGKMSVFGLAGRAEGVGADIKLMFRF